MHLTQFLIFEITPRCNLGHIHKRCPNQHPERYEHVRRGRALNNRTVIQTATAMYREHGFRGFIGFHYYNEPCCELHRTIKLMRKIKMKVPQARFVLWTNGTLLPDDMEELRAFDQIHVTDYGLKDNPVPVDKLRAACPYAQIHEWKLDDRLNMLGDEKSYQPCARQFTEFIVDYWGNVHLCCYDWRGLGSPGNIHDEPLGVLVAKWQEIRDQIAGDVMDPDAPDVCLRCKMRAPYVSLFEKMIGRYGQQYVKNLRRERARQKRSRERIAVVFVSYLKVPLRRLRDHFRWNDRLYRQAKARVYVVTDQPHELPDYAECVIFPRSSLPVVDGKPRFSLTKTKNAGIKKALGDGCDVLICTDVDMAYSDSTWRELCNVPYRAASVPVYVMAPSYERRSEGHIDKGATGTISMDADHWGEIKWDEGCVGYGADDGIILSDIREAGIKILRNRNIWHVAHDTGADQHNVPGKGRGDCYGRRDGFNFDNFDENRKLFDARRKSC